MGLHQGYFGLVLGVDQYTVRQVRVVGDMYAGASQTIEPENVHLTLYKSDGMVNVDPFDSKLIISAHQIAREISVEDQCSFRLGKVRVHGDRYLLWRASPVGPAVSKAHRTATKLLAHYVSREQKQAMVAWALALSPTIRKRDLGLVHEYGMLWVLWRNVPHLLCATDPTKLSVNWAKPPTVVHHGMFTSLRFVRCCAGGIIQELFWEIPIVPTV